MEEQIDHRNARRGGSADNRLGPAGVGLIQLPFLVLVIYPAIAAIIVRVPFLGFRIFMVHNAQYTERGPAVSS